MDFWRKTYDPELDNYVEEGRLTPTTRKRHTSPTRSVSMMFTNERCDSSSPDPVEILPDLSLHGIEQSQQNVSANDLCSTFHLLDLPTELQRLVVYHALGGPYDITLTSERISMLRSRFRVLGIPQLLVPLLLTSRHISALASTFHTGTNSLFTGRLVLNSVFTLVSLRRQVRFEWLRTYTRILHFSDSSVHPERWARYFDSFDGLKTIEIEFPVVKKLDVAVRLEDVLEGREDDRLIGCLDRFMISSLGGGGLEFWITARFALKEGAEGDGWLGIVTCDIAFDGGGTRIVKRRYSESKGKNEQAQESARGIIRANGNILDEGAHRSLWEWHHAMTS